jgi:O-antigen/teichoic acid export membrane protein
LDDKLYKNSLFIGLSRILTAFTGLIFWKIATKYYSPEDVGIATALISSLGLVLTFSKFGFDSTIIRFMPFKDRNVVFSSIFFATAIASAIVGLIYILAIDVISPALSFLKDYMIIFIVFALLNSVTMITGVAFLSLRKGEYYFAQNFINSLRIPMLIPLAIFGPLGIFYSLGFGYFVSSIIAGILILKLVNLRLELDNSFLREVSRFSLFNYITDIFYEIPLLITPLIILNILGAKAAGMYLIAFSIGSIILLIPDSISRSFLVEGCYGKNLKNELVKSFIVIYSLLIPAILSIYVFGSFLLGLFGEVYSDAHELLILYALSSLFIAVLHISNATLNIKMKVERSVELNGLRFFLIIGLSYILISKMGLIGAGYAWLIAHGILSAVILVLAVKEKWIES